ncbi:MAG: hypothetical protein K2X93_12015 [Candidatus Obscuribacterales bacterium]|nr:hypothetical protein [Candidatus Obscuribacterales bacterium]
MTLEHFAPSNERGPFSSSDKLYADFRTETTSQSYWERRKQEASGTELYAASVSNEQTEVDQEDSDDKGDTKSNTNPEAKPNAKADAKPIANADGKPIADANFNANPDTKPIANADTKPIAKDAEARPDAKPDANDKLEKQQDKPRDKAIESAQHVLVQTGQFLHGFEIAEQLKQILRKSKLSKKEANKLATSKKESVEEKLEELVTSKLRDLLFTELETQSKMIPEARMTAIKRNIEAGDYPTPLFLSMLAREIDNNNFGDISRAFYLAQKNNLEISVPHNFRVLHGAHLEKPPGFPYSGDKRITGEPDTTSRILKSERVQIGDTLADNTVPDQKDLNELIEYFAWNAPAKEMISSHRKMSNAIELGSVLTDLNRANWKYTKDQNLDEWTARVEPIVTLSIKVQSAVQALKIAEQHSVASKTKDALDPLALTSAFPGKVRVNEKNEISEIALDLPDSIEVNFENDQKLKAIERWLSKHEGRATQIAKQLTDIAVNSGKVIIRDDVPGEGEITVDGVALKYNLQRHRVSVEQHVGDDGKHKIRVRNFVNYHESEWYNAWDTKSKLVGERACLTLVEADEFKKVLTGIVTPERLDALYQKLQKQINDTDTAKRVVSTNDSMKQLREVLVTETKDADKYLDQLVKNYRDFDENDLLCVSNGEKIQLIKAKNVTSFVVERAVLQGAGKLLTVTMDVGMLISGLGYLRMAGKGMSMASRAGSAAGLEASASTTAIRQAIQKSIKNNFFHAGKSFTFGASGALLNNAEVLSTEEGKTAHHWREMLFVADGLTTLFSPIARIGRAQSADTVRVQAKEIVEKQIQSLKTVGSDSSMLDKLTHLGHFGAMTLRTNERIMGFTTLVVGSQLAQDLHKRFVGKHGENEIGSAREISERLKLEQRILFDTTSDALAGKDEKYAKELQKIGIEADKALALDGPERQEMLQKWIQNFDRATDKNQRVLIATGILLLLRKEDGAFSDGDWWHQDLTNRTAVGHELRRRFEESRGSSNEIRSRRESEGLHKIFAQEYVDYIQRAQKDATPEQQMAFGRCLLTLKLMNLQEYSTLCRNILSNRNAAVDTRLEAMIGVSDCIRQFRKDSKNRSSATLHNMYGCSVEALTKAITTETDRADQPDVSAFAMAVWKALSRPSEQETDNDIKRAMLDWHSIRLDREIKEDLQNNNGTKDETLKTKQDSLISLLKQIEEIDNPKADKTHRKQLSAPPSIHTAIVDRIKAELETKGKVENPELRFQLLQYLSNDIKSGELEKNLEALIKVENRTTAAKALEWSIDTGKLKLNKENSARIFEEIKIILEANNAEFNDVKTATIAYLPRLFERLLVSAPQKATVIKVLASALNTSDDPQLRLATCKTLDKLTKLIDSDVVPAIVKEDLQSALSSSLNPSMGNANRAASAEVRIAAYRVLKTINQGRCLEVANKFIASETDPELADQYFFIRHAALRPDRPECARRIYSNEVDHYMKRLDNPFGRSTPAEIAQLKLKYPLLQDAIWEAKLSLAKEQRAALGKVAEIRTPGWWSIFWLMPENAGRVQMEANNASLKPVLDLRAEQDNSWNELIASAKSDKSAKEMIAFLATHSNIKQKAAATEMEKLLLDKHVGNKEILFAYLGEVFNNDNNDREKLDARNIIVRALLKITEDNEAENYKLPPSTKMIVGRIAHRAIDLEIERVSDEQRLELLKLMRQCEYPLAMPLLDALAKSNKVSAAVRKDAIEFFKKLDDKDASKRNWKSDVDSLQKAFIARQKFLTTKDLSSDGMDATTIKSAINRAFCASPIKDVDDERIVILQKFLKEDEDPGVAITAAWHIINTINSSSGASEETRRWFANQPGFQTAIQALKEIAGKDKGDFTGSTITQQEPRAAAKKKDLTVEDHIRNHYQINHADTKKEAARMLSDIEQWQKNSSSSSVFRDSHPIVQAAFKVLRDRQQGLAAKQEALEKLVRLAATDFSQGSPALQKAVDNEMRIMTVDKDPATGRMAMEAIEWARRDNPFKQSEDVFGRTVLTAADGRKTTITHGLDSKRIDYPDASWMQFKLDAFGKVASYESSERPGLIEKGFEINYSVHVSSSGIVVFNKNGVRNVKLQGGDTWTYYGGNKDEDRKNFLEQSTGKHAVDQQKVLDSFSLVDDLEPKDIELRNNDPRVAVLNTIIKEGSAEAKNKAARILIDPINHKRIEAKTYESAKSVFLSETLNGKFVDDRDLIKMGQAMQLLGPINDVYDPRVKMIFDALKEGETAKIKLRAAMIVANPLNTVFADKDKVIALKSIFDVTKRVDANSKLIDADAYSVLDFIAKHLDDGDYKVDERCSISVKNKNLVEFTTSLADGYARMSFYDKSHQLELKMGDTTMKSDSHNTESNSQRHTLLNCLNTTDSDTVFRSLLNSTDENVNMVAITAKLNGPLSIRDEVIGDLVEKAVKGVDPKIRTQCDSRLRYAIMHSNPYEQTNIFKLWKRTYENVGKTGSAPLEIPVKMWNIRFPEHSTRAQQEDMLVNGLGWLFKCVPTALTGDLAQDAKTIENTKKSDRHNDHELCLNILTSLNHQHISHEKDPRRFVLRNLSKDESARVALAASFALAHSKVPSDQIWATRCLSDLANRANGSWSIAVEARSVLSDLIGFGGDNIQHSALNHGKEQQVSAADRSIGPAPKPTAEDDAKRYWHSANAKERARFLQMSPPQKTAIILALNPSMTEEKIEASLPKRVVREPIDFFGQTGVYKKDTTRFSDTYVKNENEDAIFKSLGVMKETTGAQPVPKTNANYIEVLLEKPPSTIKLKEADFADRFLQVAKGSRMEFCKSVPPEVMAVFTRELLMARPELLKDHSIDSIELSVLLKNWVLAKSTTSDRHKIWRHPVSWATLTEKIQIENDSVKFVSMESRNTVDTKATQQLRSERTASINKLLQDNMTIATPNNDTLKWRPNGSIDMQVPTILKSPPLKNLESTQKRVTKLLPSNVVIEDDGQVPLECLLKLAYPNAVPRQAGQP